MDNSFYLEIGGIKLLIDPWLEGVEVDFFSWFNTQWHRTAPLNYDQVPKFDLVLITQKYPDHFHPETLIKLNPKQVIAPKSIEKKLQKLLPEASIIGMDAKFDQTVVKDVGIRFLPTQRKIDPIYDAFIMDDGKQSVFIATHGFAMNESAVNLVKNASPCQLLLTPFNLYVLPFFLGGVVSPGLEGVKHLCEQVNPKKVIPTHDEDKHAKGLVTKFAKVTRLESTESLKKISWLADRYMAVNHYKPIQIQ